MAPNERLYSVTCVTFVAIRKSKTVTTVFTGVSVTYCTPGFKAQSYTACHTLMRHGVTILTKKDIHNAHTFSNNRRIWILDMQYNNILHHKKCWNHRGYTMACYDKKTGDTITNYHIDRSKDIVCPSLTIS